MNESVRKRDLNQQINCVRRINVIHSLLPLRLHVSEQHDREFSMSPDSSASQTPVALIHLLGCIAQEQATR